MSSSSERLGRDERAGRAAQLDQDDKPAKIQILHDVTSDSPDGQPWPPDGTALWAIVRRADGCTLWRAFQLAQVRTAATDFCNFPDRQQAQLKRQL